MGPHRGDFEVIMRHEQKVNVTLLTIVRTEVIEKAACREIPQLDGTVLATRYDPVSVGREAHCTNSVSMLLVLCVMVMEVHVRGGGERRKCCRATSC